MTFFCACSTTNVPGPNEWKTETETEQFCSWQIERVNEHILSLTLLKTWDKGQKRVVTTTITASMVRRAHTHKHNRDMCTHAMTSHKTECDLNIYELECELIEWAEWEWERRQWIKMWCDNATNHHVECSVRVRVHACMRAYCTYNHDTRRAEI